MSDLERQTIPPYESGVRTRSTASVEDLESKNSDAVERVPTPHRLCERNENRPHVAPGMARRAELDFSTACSIHALIEQRASQNPHQTAVVCQEKSLTYEALNFHANQIAHRLRALGVGPEIPVAICMERSLSMVAGILGVLKAGGAYVPLDPDYPIGRLTFMLEDTNAPVVLTQPSLTSRIPATRGHLLVWDDGWTTVASEPGGTPAANIAATHLAYIIYTSGSTGKPKGVMVTHENLIHATWDRVIYYRKPVTSYLLLSSFSFDSSIAGLFWTLCDGGTLVLPGHDSSRDPSALASLAARHRVSHLLGLPSFYSHLLEHADQLTSLRSVIVAGESCSPALVARHRERLPQTALYNEYGPTEATVWATVFECDGQPADLPIPIGRSIAHAEIRLLDAQQHPVPLGQPGEIYIGGKGVARGYLNQSKLTAEKFVPDVFRPGTQARLYRTGDLGRYRADGNIEFLGRVDHQVKIRGHRVELEEIESVLKQHPDVRDAVVLVRNQGTAPGSSGAREEDVRQLTAALSSLGDEEASKLLRDIENPIRNGAISPNTVSPSTPAVPASDRHVVRSAESEIWLNLDKDFIRPPRDSQRNWLVNRALQEWSDDLQALDRAARRFVPGVESSVPELVQDRTQAVLRDEEILEDWHIPLMRAMARIVTEQHGDVLEIGFGRGISATMIQEFGVRSHTLIECNDYIVETHFKPWRERHSDRDIRLVHSTWQEAIERLGEFDGVFFQTYPLNEREFVEYLSRSATFAEHFMPIAAQHLKPGGAFTYLTHEIDSMSRRHQRLLFQYFSAIALSVQRLRLPENCRDLWWSDSMVVVKAVK